MKIHPFSVAMLLHLIKDIFEVKSDDDAQKLQELTAIALAFHLGEVEKTSTVDGKMLNLFAKAAALYNILDLDEQLDPEIFENVDNLLPMIDQELELTRKIAKDIKATAKNGDVANSNRSIDVDLIFALIQRKKPLPKPLEKENGHGVKETVVEVSKTKGTFDFKKFIKRYKQTSIGERMMAKYKDILGIDLEHVSRIEELPFYKEFLSRFDIKDLRLVVPNEKSDYDLLLRLVAGSIAIEYEFSYDKNRDAALLHMELKGILDHYLHKMGPDEMQRYLQALITEHLQLDMDKIEDSERIEGLRTQLIELFYKKLAKFHRQRESHTTRQNMDERDV